MDSMLSLKELLQQISLVSDMLPDPDLLQFLEA